MRGLNIRLNMCGDYKAISENLQVSSVQWFGYYGV